jgi:hypothetical protein
MRDTRAIFVEGIIGSGKSKTAQLVADYLEQSDIPAHFMPEGGKPHPLRISASLEHPSQTWLDVTIDEFIERSIDAWRAFARTAKEVPTVTVFDGQLFHGNMTDLMLMDADASVLKTYVLQIIEELRDLAPVLIYFYQRDVDQALRAAFVERGAEWEAKQLNWKLPTPYGIRRNLEGIDGFVELYRNYRAICDAAVTVLPIDKLEIDNTDRVWPEYWKRILAFFELPCDG